MVLSINELEKKSMFLCVTIVTYFVGDGLIFALHFVQSNNCYIFPGMGLGCVISGAIRVHDDMFLAAAEALASQIRPEHLARRQLFPAFSFLLQNSSEKEIFS
jgi:malic enzyme